MSERSRCWAEAEMLLKRSARWTGIRRLPRITLKEFVGKKGEFIMALPFKRDSWAIFRYSSPHWLSGGSCVVRGDCQRMWRFPANADISWMQKFISMFVLKGYIYDLDSESMDINTNIS